MWSIIRALLLWLDQPAHYWTLVTLGYGSVASSALLSFFGPIRWQRWNHPVLFAALLGVSMIAFRWPVCFDNTQGNNPDESQMIAGAIVLKSSPVFWKDVDGTTHGPLAQWPLALEGLAGIRLDFTNARLLSVGLAWLTLVFTWLTLRVFFDEGLSRVLVLPMALFEASMDFWDFTQYSSEHVSIALLAGGTWLVVSETLNSRASTARRLYLAGLLLGAVPFAKLQGTPLSLWIGAVGVLFIFLKHTLSWWERTRLVNYLIAGCITVPAVFFVQILANRIWPDFWSYYIESNIMYAKTFPMDWSHARESFMRLAAAENFPAYFYPSFWLMIAGALLCLPRRWSGRELQIVGLSLGLLALSIYVTLLPNRQYTHYLQFVIAPLALATGAVVGMVIQSGRALAARAKGTLRYLSRLAPVALFLAIGTYSLVHYSFTRTLPSMGRFTATDGKLSRSPVADWLINHTSADESVAIWGWEPHYFVEANRKHATREAHTALQIYDSPVRSAYISRYLHDLKTARPPAFVDVVGPGSFAFQDQSKHGHETVPELKNFIAENYRLVTQIGSARIYGRRDVTFRDP